jgi:hypothetical protein
LGNSLVWAVFLKITGVVEFFHICQNRQSFIEWLNLEKYWRQKIEKKKVAEFFELFFPR